MDLIGLSIEEAVKKCEESGIIRITIKELRNGKQGRADTMLVVREKFDGDCAELVATPFIMKARM